MDIEEIRAKNFELQQENKVLAETIRNLTTQKQADVPHIKADDLAPGGQHAGQIDLKAIASGRVVIDMPEKPKPELKAGEILASDPSLATRLEEVASGKLRVVTG